MRVVLTWGDVSCFLEKTLVYLYQIPTSHPVLISDAPVQRYNSIAVPDELELPLWFLGLAGRFLHEKLCHLCVV